MPGTPSSTRSKKRSPSQYVEENNPFLSLFPHRYDFLYAEIPVGKQKAEWQTETKYPLSDRMIEQGGKLYGVRFGKTTNYAVLDIDINSAYHPKHDPWAIDRILAALEPLGMVRSLIISSSYSGGIHIYLPFAQAQKSGSLALAMEALLELKGFKIAAGQLEILPDPKPYSPKGKPQLYNGHRLPLQSGSYLLSDDWEPIYSPQAEFVRRWQYCANLNEVTESTIKHILKTYRRRQHHISAKASKFLNDLHTEIEAGWTDHGQTNRILGRIAMREYIFGHILTGGSPLEGSDLVQQIVKVAIALPGYSDCCRHQHEIHKRAEEWAHSIETSRYFHYGSKSSTLSTLKSSEEEEKPSWNEQQSQRARDKIRQAIATMLNQDCLPTTATARFKALTSYKISGTTLYRHRDLWHPEHLKEATLKTGVEMAKMEAVEMVPEGAGSLENGRARLMEDRARTVTSLLGANGCNPSQEEDLSELAQPSLEQGCNVQSEQLEILAMVQPAATQEAIEKHKRIRQEQQQQRHIERMQKYLDSGDPILMAEAIAWAQLNPGILKERNA